MGLMTRIKDTVGFGHQIDHEKKNCDFAFSDKGGEGGDGEVFTGCAANASSRRGHQRLQIRPRD